jgi:hypothetical protein
MYGIPHMINAFAGCTMERWGPWDSQTGAHNRETAEFRQDGVNMFYYTYGETVEATRDLLSGVHLDFGTPPFVSQERQDKGLRMLMKQGKINGVVDVCSAIAGPARAVFMRISTWGSIDAKAAGWMACETPGKDDIVMLLIHGPVNASLRILALSVAKTSS